MWNSARFTPTAIIGFTNASNIFYAASNPTTNIIAQGHNAHRFAPDRARKSSGAERSARTIQAIAITRTSGATHRENARARVGVSATIRAK